MKRKKPIADGEREFSVAAEAHGTYSAKVLATSFEAALEIARAGKGDWELCDAPEVGELLEVTDTQSSESRELVAGELPGATR